MNKILRSILHLASVLVILLFGIFFAGKYFTVQAQTYPYWESFNSSNSPLPNNYITTITIDNDGSKWIGTYGGGVAHFDGVNWTIYNTANSGLPNNKVQAITIDHDGSKWISTAFGGIAHFDGANWTVYNSSNTPLPNYTDGSVFGIAIDQDGSKWFGLRDGAAHFDGVNWTIYNTSNSGLPGTNIGNEVFEIAIDQDGTKWFTTRGGVAHFDGANWTTYNTANSGLANNWTETMGIDADGTKWFGHQVSGGVSKFDDTNWTNYTTSNSGLASDWIQRIFIDSAGAKWFATVYGGATMFDGANWMVYNTSNSGIASNIVISIAIANDGSDRWFGTSDGGVSVLHVYPVNHAPVVNPITVSPNPAQVNSPINASVVFTDVDTGDTHTAVWDWGDNTTSSGTVDETTGSVNGSHTYTQAGVYTVNLTVTDDHNASGTAPPFRYLSVYNPTPQGLFSGARLFTSPSGAVIGNPSVTGTAQFGITARYAGNIATGNFSMNFRSANINFAATGISVLVTSDTRATLRGTGVYNEMPNYSFLITGDDGPDDIRIQIKDPSGNVVYDTQPNASDMATPTTPITGQIIIH